MLSRPGRGLSANRHTPCFRAISRPVVQLRIRPALPATRCRALHGLPDEQSGTRRPLLCRTPSEMTDASPVVINLPPADKAPAYRNSLSRLFEFVVEDFGGLVAIAPREGAGATRNYFTAHRLCGDGDEITEETRRPCGRTPPMITTQPAPEVGRRLSCRRSDEPWAAPALAPGACVRFRDPAARVP